jgi:hypothetical protein
LKSSVRFIQQHRNGNTHYKITIDDVEHLDKEVTFFVSVTSKGKVHFIEVPEQDEAEVGRELEREIAH